MSVVDSPVVEGRGALGELQMQHVDLLEHALGVVQREAAALRERAQPVPLPADALAARVHRAHLVVLQRTVQCNIFIIIIRALLLFVLHILFLYYYVYIIIYFFYVSLFIILFFLPI